MCPLPCGSSATDSRFHAGCHMGRVGNTPSSLKSTLGKLCALVQTLKFSHLKNTCLLVYNTQISADI